MYGIIENDNLIFILLLSYWFKLKYKIDIF
jgi:hypothetical protein